ncbi:hypothetical protein [Chryseobacterium hispalense]|uniref:hypothetical protein n=1 Tax=Chryseobacterium hispalense TaxID=1453492 RepID=UPI00391E00A7
MYEKKRFLVKTVFETAKKELPKGSKSSISSYLSSLFEERYNFSRDERSYTRYYKSLVEENTDYNIDDLTLLYLSKYLGYDNYDDFCNRVNVGDSNLETFSLSLSEKFQQIFITVTPTIVLPDFIKKNGMGILEMTFVILLVTGGVVFSNPKNPNRLKIISDPNPPATNKPFMYWDRDRYIATDSSSLGPQVEVIPMDKENFLYLKKITRPDTLTVDNALHKVWYNKSNNEVEFFTSFGKHPESGKTLKEATEYIIETYGGE